jgi:hypothetical protein
MQIETIAGHEVHPLASLWPTLKDKELADFETDVKFHGVRHPVTIDQHGRIVDGRTRAKAWEILNGENPDWGKRFPLPIQTVHMPDELAVYDFILSSNRERRHISKDQVVAIALQMNNLLDELVKEAEAAKAPPEGSVRNPAGIGGKSGKGLIVNTERCSQSIEEKPKRDAKEMHARSTTGKLAKKAGVSNRKAAQAKKVGKASKELNALVATGAIDLVDAAKVADFPELVQTIVSGEKPIDAVVVEAKAKTKPIEPNAKHLPKVVDWLNRTATMAEVEEVHKVCVSILGL